MSDFFELLNSELNNAVGWKAIPDIIITSYKLHIIP